jgi:hypothetical protein
MRKLAVIYNTCGINAKNENVDAYIDSINSILNQNFDDYELIISGCMNTPNTENKLIDLFKDRVSFNFTQEIHPVNVTFNHSAIKAFEHFGEFDGYMYVDSGMNFDDNPNVLQDLYDLYKSGPYGLTIARPSTDSGVYTWFKLGENIYDESGQEELIKDGHFIFPLGKTFNMHCMIFSKELFNAYDHKLFPDIFASHCTESVFTYLTASVKQKFILHKDLIVRHIISMDGPSSGFNPHKSGKIPWQHLYRSPKPMVEILKDPEAFESGFGYEECSDVFPHNVNAYDEGENHKDPERLLNFIKNNLYLKQDKLDYNKIKSKLIWK